MADFHNDADLGPSHPNKDPLGVPSEESREIVEDHFNMARAFRVTDSTTRNVEALMRYHIANLIGAAEDDNAVTDYLENFSRESPQEYVELRQQIVAHVEKSQVEYMGLYGPGCQCTIEELCFVFMNEEANRLHRLNALATIRSRQANSDPEVLDSCLGTLRQSELDLEILRSTLRTLLAPLPSNYGAAVEDVLVGRFNALDFYAQVSVADYFGRRGFCKPETPAALLNSLDAYKHGLDALVSFAFVPQILNENVKPILIGLACNWRELRGVDNAEVVAAILNHYPDQFGPILRSRLGYGASVLAIGLKDRIADVQISADIVRSVIEELPIETLELFEIRELAEFASKRGVALSDRFVAKSIDMLNKSSESESWHAVWYASYIEAFGQSGLRHAAGLLLSRNPALRGAICKVAANHPEQWVDYVPAVRSALVATSPNVRTTATALLAELADKQVDVVESVVDLVRTNFDSPDAKLRRATYEFARVLGQDAAPFLDRLILAVRDAGYEGGFLRDTALNVIAKIGGRALPKLGEEIDRFDSLFFRAIDFLCVKAGYGHRSPLGHASLRGQEQSNATRMTRWRLKELRNSLLKSTRA